MKKLHMIGNAHLDPVWLWDWREGSHENMATLYSAIERLEEFEDVVFTSSSAQFYEWIEEMEPEMFERIRKYVKQGRWIICGGWWVQPDCNLPDGESYVRHALISQNYFKSRFGTISTVGYNVDSFGHNGNMPALLRQAGMDSYVFMRPGPSEKELPGRNFIWESKDGSRVAAFRIPFTYCTFGNLESHIDDCKKEFDSYSDHCICFYGVGNHGGGPTIENIETIRRIMEQAEDEDRVRLVFDSPKGYFDSCREEQKDWPVVHGELQHHASGCYSVVSKMKEWNRKTEHELLRAEKYCEMERGLLDAMRQEDFTRAWKNLLFNQFHDTLAGSAIERAYEDVWIQLGESRSIAARNENRALQRLSFAVDIPFEEKMIPVVVFNPHSFPCCQTVEFETGFFSNDPLDQYLEVKNSKGELADYQFINPEAKIPNRTRIAFKASVGAFGYETYRIVQKGGEWQGIPGVSRWKKVCGENCMERAVLENDRLRIVFDGREGAMVSFYDKNQNLEYMEGGAGSPVVFTDESDTWGHGVFRFDDLCGRYHADRMFYAENGPVRSTLVIQWSYERSYLEQRFTLEQGSDSLKVLCTVDWREQNKCLKLQFPLNLMDCTCTCQVPFGIQERAADGEEQPMLVWSDVSGRQKGDCTESGLCFLTDSKSSGALDGSSYYITVLRSPAFVHHHPYQIEEGEQVSYVDQGKQTFTYEMAPHKENWQASSAVRKALMMNQPMTLVPQSCHPGNLPQRYNGIVCNCSHVVLSAFKRAQDGCGTVVRFYETEGREARALIEIPMIKFAQKLVFSPYEIQSFYVADQGSEVKKVNFMEWDKNE